MATSLDSISGIGANARKLAKLLQAKAPEGHMLAYINPQEAALLKANGGSGKPEPETGIPSFQPEGGDDDYGSVAAGGGDVYGDAGATADPAVTNQYGFGEYPVEAGFTQAPYTSGNLAQDRQLVATDIADRTPAIDTSRAASDAQTLKLMGQGAEKTPEEKSLIKQAADKLGVKEEMLGRLGIAGISGLLGARQASQAAKAGQAGKAELQALAAPYQQKGAELQAQAQRGELTPQALQSLQAAQAQVAQGVQNRGGVGAAQAQMQIEQLRQQLLQNQYDYGLKLSGIGDNITIGAIKTGMQADQYANQLTNSYFNNIARTIFSQGGQTPPPPAQG
jgi:hypothetical protein